MEVIFNPYKDQLHQVYPARWIQWLSYFNWWWKWSEPSKSCIFCNADEGKIQI